MERRNYVPNLLAMYIRNTREIYDITAWLQDTLIKKINKGVQPQVEHLAKGKIKPYIKRSKTIPIYHP